MLALQKGFNLTDEQVLSASSTGTIVAAVDANVKREVEEELLKIGVSASFCGTFTQENGRVLMRSGKSTTFPRVADDPYERILSGKV